MPRHVGRVLPRPCAVPQWRSHNITPSTRRSNSTTPASPPAARSHQDTIDILRAADQQSLQKSKSQVESLISSINLLSTRIASIPLTVQLLPNIPPYTLGYLHTKTTKDFPAAASKAVSSAENLRQHLIDLQFEQYVDRQDSAMQEFENEMRSWSQEEKEQTLQNWLYDEEAMKGRLDKSAEKLLEFVTEMKETSTKPKVAAVSNPFESSGKKAAGEDKPGKEKKMGAPAETKAAESEDLSLQEKMMKMMAKLNAERGKK